MTLPLALTDLDGACPVLGPFKLSNGTFVLFGQSLSSPFGFKQYTSSDPTSSWTGGTGPPVTFNGYETVAGYQVGDTIHILIGDAAATATVDYLRWSLTGGWEVASENVVTANTATSAGVSQAGCSLVVRSTGEVIAFYNSAQVVSMSTGYSRVSYRRRDTGGTWQAAVAVDAGGTIDYMWPEAVLGASDRVHFLYNDGVGSSVLQRALNSSNVLQTVTGTTPGGFMPPTQAVSYISGGNTIVSVSGGAFESWVNTNIHTLSFTSVDSPSPLSLVVAEASREGPARMFVDDTTLYVLYFEALDFTRSGNTYVESSTDGGATWGNKTLVRADGTNLLSTTFHFAKDGAVYQRGLSVVIPYVINQNGTIQYNEYLIRLLNPQVGMATETDTAFSITPVKPTIFAPLGWYSPLMVPKTWYSQSIGTPRSWFARRWPTEISGLVVAVGQAIGTSSAFSVGKAKLKALGLSTSANTGQTARALRTKPVGEPTSANTAQTVAKSRARTVGEPTETDSATAVAKAKLKALGLSAETDSVLLLTRRRTRTLAEALETDSAFTHAHLRTKTLGQSLETDSSQTARPLEVHPIGLASEADTGQTIARLKLKTLGLAWEFDDIPWSADVGFEWVPPEALVVAYFAEDEQLYFGDDASKSLTDFVEGVSENTAAPEVYVV